MSFGGSRGNNFSTGGYGGASARSTGNTPIQLRREDFSNLPVFEKNFYVEHPAVTARCCNSKRSRHFPLPLQRLHNTCTALSYLYFCLLFQHARR